MPENRTKTGRFAAGTSGNPGGRPRIGEQERAAREALKGLCLSAVALLENTIRDDEAPLALRLRAAEYVVDRVCGKAMSTRDVDAANEKAEWLGL